MTSTAVPEPDRIAELTGALAAVRSRLARAAEAAGRNVADIEMLPVTKFCPATDVAILLRLGCRAFGESREQEASAKVRQVAEMSEPGSPPACWHMIGNIQRNKARSLADWAHTAHSVSSAKAVRALDHAVSPALAEGRRSNPLRLYVQISLDGDLARGGVDVSKPVVVEEICEQIEDSESLVLAGLMGIPPLGWDPDAAYARLHAEHCRVLESHPNAVGLSAGMSNDLEIAVKHGSTCVRVGTALLGARRIPSP